MTKIRKLAAVCFCVLAVLCACGKQGPAAGADRFMQALTTMDLETLKTYDNELASAAQWGGDEESREILQTVFGKIKWETGEQRIEGEYARVELRITAMPMKQAFGEYEEHVKSNLQSYREKYQEMEEKQYKAAILEDKLVFLRAYEKTKTTSVWMDLVQKDGVWTASHCENLQQALLGE